MQRVRGVNRENWSRSIILHCTYRATALIGFSANQLDFSKVKRGGKLALAIYVAHILPTTDQFGELCKNGNLVYRQDGIPPSE